MTQQQSVKTYEVFTITGSQVVQATSAIEAILQAGNPNDLIGIQIADTTPPLDGKEEIEFGEWLNKNAYPSYDSNGKPCGWNLHKGMDGNIYSTSELYTTFINSLPEPPQNQ